MKKLLVWAAILTIVAIAVPATAGGRSVATISFAGTARTSDGGLGRGDAVSFAVDPVRVKDRDLYSLWVANWCYQDGVAVSAQFIGVSYPSYRQGWAGDFTLDGAEWDGGSATCTAYVWKFPASHDPLPGASMTYDVG